MITVLECQGIGAKKFLHGQLTCDMNALSVDIPQFTVGCNIQGRVIFTTDLVMKHDQLFLLVIPKAMTEIAITHLSSYARFSRCEIQLGEISNKIICQNKQQRIHAGIPTIYPQTSGLFIPQRLGIPPIPGALSFKKGCYLGQEIIARLHFKGTTKYELCRGEVPQSASLHIGDDIQDTHRVTRGTLIDYDDDLTKEKKIILFSHEITNKTPTIHGFTINNTLATYRLFDYREVSHA